LAFQSYRPGLPGQKPSQANLAGLAYFGLAWPGLQLQARAGTSLLGTNDKREDDTHNAHDTNGSPPMPTM